MANYTKVKVQELQRTLYLAAKENPKRRFHALYDKVYRKDVMTRAWQQVKRNKGSAGIDGVTIEAVIAYGEERMIEETIELLKRGTYHPQPTRRQEIPKADGKMRPLGIPTVQDRLIQAATKIVIESIFEADFRDCSYGFRPKRGMHDALRQIRRTVNDGQVYWVVDVDITAYFDNIQHDKLMAMIEQRISDRRILKLIRKWLKAGYVKDDQFHETEIGSPQGGVISPLLANIYLNYLDTLWEKRFSQLGTLVRFADDMVIMCRRKEQALEAIDVLKAVFTKLELTINKTKSKLVNLWIDKPGFDFLGHHHCRMQVMRKGGKTAYILRSFPSKKAMKKMREAVKEVTAPRHRLPGTLDEMVKELNPKIQGWRNYYAAIDPSVSNRFLSKIDWYIRKRLSLFWRKKHKKHRTFWSRFTRALEQSGVKSATSWKVRTA